ncbi:unnamed protein product [Effrenium voratum]|uniref:Ribosomal protein L22 n=1 Tax=Effrenium voratum TaxID=2562239 RepID=A0AA36JRU5_9DINO|nr:unnamed protein product [Effrenium voratum]
MLSLLRAPTKARAAAATQTRDFYFPRKHWFPWRVRLVRQRQAALRAKRHIWPRRQDPEEAPIFGDKEGDVLSFREEEVRISVKKLEHYAKIMKHKQIQDAYDWVDSLSRMKSEVILKLLEKAMEECRDRRGWDLGRTYVVDPQPGRGHYVKSLRKHSRGRYGIMKAPRNNFIIRVRQMPLEEWFHRIFIYNKVPRSLSGDMRLALHQKRVSPQMQKEWSPYLHANSRLFHRKELKWLDSTRQFDYYQVRREWIEKYKANLLRSSTEAREARGLPPLPMAE